MRHSSEQLYPLMAQITWLIGGSTTKEADEAAAKVISAAKRTERAFLPKMNKLSFISVAPLPIIITDTSMQLGYPQDRHGNPVMFVKGAEH